MARQLQEHEEEILDAKDAALEFAARAKDASNVKSQSLANMSHEIRTPLTSILGFAEELREQSTDPEPRKSLDIILRNCRHLERIINDILDLSKIEAGKMRLSLEVCSPTRIAYQSVDLVAKKQGCNSAGLEVQLVV